MLFIRIGEHVGNSRLVASALNYTKILLGQASVAFININRREKTST